MEVGYYWNLKVEFVENVNCGSHKPFSLGLQGLDGRDGLPGEPGLDGMPGKINVSECNNLTLFACC